MKAKVTWAEGMRFVGVGDSGHGVLMDSRLGESPQVGASPMEMVLLALGGCSSIDVVDILRKMRQDLSSLEVNLSADRASDPPRVFVKAELEFVASGEGLTQASLKRAVDLSMDKYCSVAAMLQKSGAQVTYRSRVKPKDAPDSLQEVGRKAEPASLHAAETHPRASADLPFPGGPPPGPRGATK